MERFAGLVPASFNAADSDGDGDHDDEVAGAMDDVPTVVLYSMYACVHVLRVYTGLCHELDESS